MAARQAAGATVGGVNGSGDICSECVVGLGGTRCESLSGVRVPRAYMVHIMTHVHLLKRWEHQRG